MGILCNHSTRSAPREGQAEGARKKRNHVLFNWGSGRGPIGLPVDGFVWAPAALADPKP